MTDTVLAGISLPRYSINGSPRSHLMEPLLAALLAIKATDEQLAQCAPHGRDYPDTAINAAITQHREFRKQLFIMHHELMHLAVHIDQTWPAIRLTIHED